MATDMLQYLDLDGLDETVLNIGQIKTNLEGQISALGESIEEELQNLSYARPDGIYPDMTVGAVIGADETAQWAQRVTAGSGAATVRSVQGVSVVWAQLNDNNANSATVSGVTFTKNSDGSWTADGTATADIQKYIVTGLAIVGGHSYLVKGCPAGGGANAYSLGISNVKIDTGAGGIYTIMSSATGVGFILNVSNGQTLNNLVFTPQLFDLTAMFGSGNEPSTVADFEAMYPEPYYPYSAPTLKPVQIAGITSTDANGDALDAIEWSTQTLWGAGTAGDMLYADHIERKIGVIDLGSTTLQWSINGADSVYTPGVPFNEANNNVVCESLTTVDRSISSINMPDNSVRTTSNGLVIIKKSGIVPANARTMLSGVLLYYELATSTTTPISPALPMTYRVEQGGTESIIVPTGEISAAPVITIAEPVNAGDEFARIWAAIESLGYTRNAAQLSRPISLTDVGSVDEVQKDTTDVVEKEPADVAEIDTVKEVQE